MGIRVEADGREIELNPFMQDYLRNIIKGILFSLKGGQNKKKAFFCMQERELKVIVDDEELSLKLGHRPGFTKVLVRDTLKGITKHLKGIKDAKEIKIEAELMD